MAIEYPEAVIIAGQMRPRLPGRTVARVVARDPLAAVFRWGFSNLDQVDLTGQRIEAVRGFGDNIFVDLQVHTLAFGDMIGRILYHAPGVVRPPRAAVLFELDDGAAFSYNPTLYGLCKAFEPAAAQALIPATWVQPLDAAFTPDYLARAFSEPERKIAKQMNVFNVRWKAAGVGNGYWQEILFRCGVHPKRRASDITSTEMERLHAETGAVLRAALAAGGSAEEKNFLGESGGYVRAMGGRLKGQPCPECGRPVQGQNILGANVYFCANCQH